MTSPVIVPSPLNVPPVMLTFGAAKVPPGKASGLSVRVPGPVTVTLLLTLRKFHA